MEQTRFEFAKEIIGQAVHDYISPDNSENKPAFEAVDSLLTLASEGYVLVTWPESQDYMENLWFEEEAILASLETRQDIGSSAYFIPIKRIMG